MIYEFGPDDDPRAFDDLPGVEWVTLKHPVTGDVQRVPKDSENLISIFQLCGYVVEERDGE